MEPHHRSKPGLKSHSMAGSLEINYGSALNFLKTLQKLQKNDISFHPELGFEENKLRCLFDTIFAEFLRSLCKKECFLPLPPIIGNGESVDLLNLYLAVREKGGYDVVSKNGWWDLVAEELGLSSSVGSIVKLIYSEYLSEFDSWSKKIVNEKDLKRDIQDRVVMEIDTDFSEVSNVSDPKKEDKTDNIGNSCEISTDLVGDSFNWKRKREGFEKMLSWILNVAKDPCNLALGLLPDRSKWKSFGEDQLWKQVLIAREMTFSKRNVHSVADRSSSSFWRRPMHPSMYEDPERVRRQRVIPVKESSSKTRAPLESSSDLNNDFIKKTESFSKHSIFLILSDNEYRNRVPLGPKFQAHVLEFTKEAYESDPKWLGSRVWPLENKEKYRYLIERERIGKGRQNSCGCQFIGSIECVRFHIAEKRIRIKLEIGSAFFHWKFNKMGEEVALSWTKKEEETFQGVVKSNPISLQKCFWDELVKAFPSKKREELVSYYFNVFVLKRRSYQNRSAPSNIDSDDEAEFGSLTDGFSHDSSKNPSSIFYSPKKVR